MDGPARAGGPGRAGPQRSAGWSALECVLDLLARLLQVAFGLVDLAFGLQVRVVGGLAHGLLDLALDLGDLVGRLVFGAHGDLPFLPLTVSAVSMRYCPGP